MTETKPVLHATRRHNYLEMPKSVARPSGDKTFVKFGKEVDIQDFINAGAENCQIMKHIENAGGLENLRAAGIKDVDDTVIDRGMDFITLNRINKIVKIAENKLLKEQMEKEATEKANNSEEPKGE